MDNNKQAIVTVLLDIRNKLDKGSLTSQQDTIQYIDSIVVKLRRVD